MFDAALRRVIDPPLDAVGRRLAGAGISANAVTVAGFVVGLGAVPALAVQRYDLALALIVANRLADGLDGAVARTTGPSDLGGYLDIVLDFIFYSAVVFGVALGRPEEAVLAAFLIFSFIGTGASFLAYAIIAAKRGQSTEARGRKSIFYLGGLTEGAETIACFVAICLFPGWFPWIAGVFGAMCWLTTASRIGQAVVSFRD
ncbi:CDP-alcohol phosphatidyltransferase family protein [Thalassobaculum sp. OXR-137]|uniref:CDP-alcohol phosphatidyltransferase family protein n=1 Tax=Thalassobaculum sp. OXR-137 TaxID=3100173 RepID=UPI002AC98738|nr:CDP-alcohol phosphatidyltransferase family protein [Thalassobaculum sp. OXR-137]WPZ33442.1 CDP-alcohol phosphatidyltransferase family protein [Thalassobaculum sp. OXR-137]